MMTTNHLSLLCFFLLTFPACMRVNEAPKQVCFGDRCVEADIARTPEARARGLQGRSSLGEGEGMLFIFQEEGYQGFWMKETLIPLDIIWFGADKRVVAIMSDIQPCATDRCPVHTPNKTAMYVLEVNAGVAAKGGLRVGDQARF